jgi:hypothetical protein
VICVAISRRYVRLSEGEHTAMKARILLATMAAGALGAGAMLNTAHAQVPGPGTLFVLHSQAQGTCPALDWHGVVGDNGTLSGMVAWNDMKTMARVTGTTNAEHQFSMTATEIGGAGKTATITGQRRPADGYLVANINGPDIACHEIEVPIFRRGGGNG